MDKTYQPEAIERKWYEKWESAGYFKGQGKGVPYCIMIPPPNVTGTLHMGHGFQDTLMDALIRYHRMKGFDTHWQVGTDHAGIATQMVVERQLQQNNMSRHDLGREAFVEKVWQWKADSGSAITQQIRRLGCSLDWEQERFTMDASLSKTVQEVFIRLFEEGLIFRGKRLVNWDPTLQTAVSDLEVVNKAQKGHLWFIRYPLVSPKADLSHIIVATTRPETMLGDVAVAVHPDDERYQEIIGDEVFLPLTGRTIRIIADEYVDPLFGTGCVKITPAHDINDYAIGKRHDLPMINIFTPKAQLNDQVPVVYQGLDRFEARAQIVKALEEQKLLKQVKEHDMIVPYGDRSGDVIEPYLTDQWFVKAKALAKPAIEAVRNGSVRFIPENWDKTYYQWMENIEDWCISRQLWWGHRIPAWYDEKGKVYVGMDEKSIRETHQLGDLVVLTQDEDVLDTWFSSALWPFSTLGWPEKTPEYERYFPTSVLVTGFDIIFFWVARMIMMSLKFTGKIPFHEVYVTGLIRDSEGQKMSKSKGNVLDPLDLIDGITLEDLLEKRTKALMQPHLKNTIIKQTKKEFPNGIAPHGTDALRFTYCALASTGRDIRFDLSRLEGYRNFCNKLWNAARYVLMNTEHEDVGEHGESLAFSVPDLWIQSRLQKAIKKVEGYFQQYRFDLIAKTGYEFVWNEYCDWYLELSKPVLYGEGSSAQKRGTRYTLLSVLETILRLLHPCVPFITEEIWQRVAPLTGKKGESIMLQAFPSVDEDKLSEKVEANVAWLQSVIIEIRTIRAEMNIAPSKVIPLYFNKCTREDMHRIKNMSSMLSNIAKLSEIICLKDGEEVPLSATALVGEMEILIPMKNLIDKDAELLRLSRSIEKFEKEHESLTIKLGNTKFSQCAPAEVVEKERQRLLELDVSLLKLRQQQNVISSL